jgi:hypothetical protein
VLKRSSAGSTASSPVSRGWKPCAGRPSTIRRFRLSRRKSRQRSTAK